jgi:excisionase family DNA binding protein
LSTTKLLTVREARKLLGKRSDGAVYHAIAQGVIPPGPLVRLGREIRFNERLLIEWIERGGTAGDQKNETRNQTQSVTTQV